MRGRLQVLQSFETMKRSFGLNGNEANRGIKFMETFSCPHHRARGAQAGEEMGNLAVGLLDDFRARGFVMSAWVFRIPVLVGINVEVGLLFEHLLRFKIS